MSVLENQSEVRRGNDWSGTTHWSAVLAAGQTASPRAAAAMDELCRAYWYPLYAYVRRGGHSVDEAQDLTQEFFARLIEKQWIAEADRSKGRFRTFLLTGQAGTTSFTDTNTTGDNVLLYRVRVPE